MEKVFYETPNKALSYATLTVQILAVLLSLTALLCSAQVVRVDPSVRGIIWWVAFGFVALGFILEYISNLKKTGSSRIVAFSFLGGVIAVVFLIISSLLRLIIR